MGLKLTPPPSSTDNDRRRFDRMVYDALRELDKRPSATGAASDSSARTLIAALASRVAALEASGGAADIPPTMLTASETIAKYNVVTADGDRADSGTAAHAGKIVGIALDDMTSGGTFTVAPTGRVVTNYSWSWTTDQVVLWCGEDGALATSAGDGAFQQPVALVLSATAIMVLIGDPILAGTDPAGDFARVDDDGLLVRASAIELGGTEEQGGAIAKTKADGGFSNTLLRLPALNMADGELVADGSVDARGMRWIDG